MKKDHTQAMKIRKLFSAEVLGTNPRIPTMSIVAVQTMAEITTTLRRPNLSVRTIRQIEVKRAIIAVHSCQRGLSGKLGESTQDGGDKKCISEPALPKEQAGVCVQK